MATDKTYLSTYVPEDIAEAVRERAEADHRTVSSWLHLQIRDVLQEQREQQQTTANAA